MGDQRIGIFLIDGFRVSARHDRCMRVWEEYARHHSDQVRLHSFVNQGPGKVDHDAALTALWTIARAQPEQRIILTEPDFLPFPSLAQWPDRFSLEEPIEAAEYVTRDPKTQELRFHGVPGAWLVRIFKPFLKTTSLYFWKSGPFNDPCNTLGEKLEAAVGQRVRLLKQTDRRPFSYGVETPGAGVHLFWSRHYGDDPNLVIGGVKLGDVHAGVDRELEEWEP